MPKNNLLERKERFKKIFSFLKKEYPDAKCHLDYNNPVELLVGSILSAQCTDLRVNEVTKDLFRKYTNAYEFSLADIDELKEDIRSTGFFNNKAKSILECTKALVRDHDGVVPLNFVSSSIQDLSLTEIHGSAIMYVILRYLLNDP